MHRNYIILFVFIDNSWNIIKSIPSSYLLVFVKFTFHFYPLWDWSLHIISMLHYAYCVVYLIWNISWLLVWWDVCCKWVMIRIVWCNKRLRLWEVTFGWMILKFQWFISILKSQRSGTNALIHLLRLNKRPFFWVWKWPCWVLPCICLQMLHHSLLRRWFLRSLILRIPHLWHIIWTQYRILSNIFHRSHIWFVSSRCLQFGKGR